jgi:phage shock protein A
MERKIRSNEARAAATIEMEDTSLDAQFRELDYDVDIEKELEALKSQSGGSETAGALEEGGSSSSRS